MLPWDSVLLLVFNYQPEIISITNMCIGRFKDSKIQRFNADSAGAGCGLRVAGASRIDTHILQLSGAYYIA